MILPWTKILMLTITTFGSTWTKYVLFPRTMVHWKPILRSDLRCPGPRESPIIGPTSKSTQLRGQGISQEGDWVGKGFSCEAFRYQVKCDFRWYGPQYLEKKRIKVKPNTLECVSMKSSKRTPDLTYPVPDCTWNSVTTTEIIVMTKTEHNVLVDPYNLSYIDPTFLEGGRCYQSICETTTGLWVGDNLPQNHCSKMTEMNASIFTDGEDRLMLELEYDDPVELIDTCKITYCGKQGLRTSSGRFFAGNWGENVDVKEEYDRLPRCGPKETISFLSQHDLIEIEEIDQIRRILCINMLERLVTTNSTPTPFDFAQLGPSKPGWGWTHRIDKNLKFQQGLAFMDWMEPSSVVEGNVVGKWVKDKIPVVWSDWVDFRGTKLGPDGLLNYNTTLLWPLQTLTALEDKLIHMGSTIIKNSVNYTYSEGISDDDLTTTKIEHNGWFPELWTFIDKNVHWLIASVIAIVLFITILKCTAAYIRYSRIQKYEKNHSRKVHEIPEGFF
nr:putative glycoprotein 1 [Wuhan pillworm virus 2]